MKKALAFCLIWCLAAAWLPALAETALLPARDAWLTAEDGTPRTTAATVTLHALTPFDEDTLAQLNTLLSHLSLSLHTQGSAAESLGRTALFVDGAEEVWLAEQAQAGGTLLTASFLPETAFAAGLSTPTDLTEARGTDKAALLLGQTRTDLLLGLTTEDLRVMEAARALLPTLVTLGGDRWTVKTVSKNVEKMGKATQQRTLTASPEEMATLCAALALQTDHAGLKGLLSTLVFTKEQKLTILQGEGGEILSFRYSGRCGADDAHQRKAAITWTMKDDGAEKRDAFKLTSPAVSGSDKDSLTWTALVAAGSALETSFTYAAARDGDKTVYTGKAALTVAQEAAGDSLSGSVALTRTLPDESETTWTFSPEVTFDAAGSGLTGTVRAACKRDGKTATDLTVAVQTRASEPYALLIPETVVSLDTLDDAALAAWQEKAAEGLAASAVQALLRLPQGELGFLLDGLDEASIQRILSALE